MPAAKRPRATKAAAKPVEPVEIPAPEPEPVPEPVAAKDTTSRKVETPDTGVVETKEQPQPARPVPPSSLREGVPDGIILNQNDPVVIEGDDDGVSIIVSRDVYRKIIPFNANRPTYILLYARGTKVLKSRLQPVQR